jgi:hypothetical protein
MFEPRFIEHRGQRLLQAHGREDLVLFDDEASALDWLASR